MLNKYIYFKIKKDLTIALQTLCGKFTMFAM